MFKYSLTMSLNNLSNSLYKNKCFRCYFADDAKYLKQCAARDGAFR